ncbi:hypothetical protein [Mucilaginibacter sp.]|jgi:hypothetical protein|uniref:hypothetical protein n=1 Tax=Mucilaginibacter sp. TaxID=1882438 RepID=UPI0035645B05
MEKLISNDQAFINQLQRAVENGFEIDRDLTIGDIQIEAQDYLIELITPADKQVYCEVIQHGTSQHASYCDGIGTVYHSDGEIIRWQTYKQAQPNEMFVYATIVDVKGQVIELYETLNLTI